jgi:hypothetical protein
VSCRVVIEAPKRRRHGDLFRVRVDLKVPGKEIVVKRDPAEHHAHEDIYVAIRDCFDAVRRQLEDHLRRRRGDVKAHEFPPMARSRACLLSATTASSMPATARQSLIGVVDEDGRVVGIITLENLAEYLMVIQASREQRHQAGRPRPEVL